MTADVPMPTSLALSRMNMSLELPIANSRAPASSQRKAGEAAEGVAGEHEGSSPAGVVGGLPERVLGDAGRRFRDALDHAEQRHRDTEYRRDEDREQRVGDL